MSKPGEERLEQVLLVGGGNAHPLVADRDADPVAVRRLGPDFEPDRATVRREFDGVGQKVGQHVGNLGGVGFEWAQVRLDRHRHCLAAQLEIGGQTRRSPAARAARARSAACRATG